MNSAVNQASKGVSAMAVVGLVLGIFALISSWVPIVNNLSFIVGVLGLVFSIIGTVAASRGKSTGKGLAVAALIINIIACVIVLATQSLFAAALS